MFFVGLRVTGAQHDDRNTSEGIAFLQPVKNDETISHWQAQIQNNQGGPFSLGCGDRGVAIRGSGDVVVVGSQAEPQCTQQIGIVVDYQNLRFWHWSSPLYDLWLISWNFVRPFRRATVFVPCSSK